LIERSRQLNLKKKYMHKEELKTISLDMIDDPREPMRSEMDIEKLEELGRSIKRHGLIQPITVRKVGERYEVIAGHRRYKAAKQAGLVTITAIVREVDEADADAIKMHENLYRENVNPVDEARYIRLMIDKHGVEPETLAKMTGKSPAYLQSRYDLLDYPDYLLEEVQSERVNITSASWLNKITDDNVRKEYTRFAANGGLTAKRAEAWFRSWDAGNLPRQAFTYITPETEKSREPIPLKMPCVVCRQEDNIEEMRMHYAHEDCARTMKEAADRS